MFNIKAVPLQTHGRTTKGADPLTPGLAYLSGPFAKTGTQRYNVCSYSSFLASAMAGIFPDPS